MKTGTLKKVIPLCILFLLVVEVITIYSYLPLRINMHYFKEILFGYWGYGWDGMHYIRIATDGYVFPLQAFFPLYPLLIKFTDFALPLSVAQRINIFLLPLTLSLILLIMEKSGLSIGSSRKTVLALLSFPSAFFLQANYTESLYILLACLNLLQILKGKYWMAALFAALASGTKITGVVLGVVIVFSLIKKSAPVNFQDVFKLSLKSFLIILVSCAGLAVYFLYLQGEFGSAWIFFKAQSEWNRTLGVSGTSFFDYIAPLPQALSLFDVSLYRRILELASFLLAVFLLFKSYKKLNINLWLYSLGTVLLPMVSGSLLSFNRLLLCAFPLLIYGYKKLERYPLVYNVSLVLGFVLEAIGIYLFHHNVFVG